MAGPIAHIVLALKILPLNMQIEGFNAPALWQSLIENLAFYNGIRNFYDLFETFLEPMIEEVQEFVKQINGACA
jgi:hypothetical protein